jgi:biotin-dependent carboxylase-like uncharacterized protein
MLTVLKAPPFATVQDRGREGQRSAGVPPSGAMDRRALETGNLLVGNPLGSAGVEWALGGGAVRFERETAFALTGAHARATLDGTPIAPYRSQRARAGAVLHIAAPDRGRFLYLSVDGGIAVPEVLHSRATYLTSSLGGLEGRRLRTEDTLPLGEPGGKSPPKGFAVTPPEDSGELRVLLGPQADLFPEKAWARFLTQAYTVTNASDRMGYRLAGPALAAQGPASLPSEAACPGAIQVPDGGTPIVLMPDGPTVGGYPKLAVVIGPDLGRLAQCNPGEEVRFRRVSVEEAEAVYRREAEAMRALERLSAAVENHR